MYGLEVNVTMDLVILLIAIVLKVFLSDLKDRSRAPPPNHRPSSPTVPSELQSLNQFYALFALRPEQLASALTDMDVDLLEMNLQAFHDLLVRRSQRMELPDLARLMLVVVEKFSEKNKLTICPMPRSQRSTALWLVPALNKMSEQAVLLIDEMECSDVAVTAMLARVCFLVLPWNKLLTNEIYQPFRKLLVAVLTQTLLAADTRTKNTMIAHTTQDLLNIHWTFSNIKFLSKNNAQKIRESLLTLAEGLEDGELMQATICEVSQ